MTFFGDDWYAPMSATRYYTGFWQAKMNFGALDADKIRKIWTSHSYITKKGELVEKITNGKEWIPANLASNTICSHDGDTRKATSVPPPTPRSRRWTSTRSGIPSADPASTRECPGFSISTRTSRLVPYSRKRTFGVRASFKNTPPRFPEKSPCPSAPGRIR